MNAKRWIAIFLAVVLTLSLIAGVLPMVFAAEVYTIGLRDSAKNTKITAEPGATVEGYLYLAGNPGILSAGVLVECPDGIKITGAKSALSGHNFTPVWQYSKSYDTNPYLVWMLAPTGTSNKALVTYNGNWCKLSFRIDAGLATGDYTIRLSAPRDKNLTAETTGGVIKPNTNAYIESVAVSNFTISVRPSQCNHNWGSWKEITSASCDEDGKQMRKCALCWVEQEETIPAAGHKMGSWVSVEAPTCKKAGKEKQECQNCQFSQVRTVEKLTHQFGAFTVEKEATCEKEGLKVSVCTQCNEKKTEKIPRLQHKFSEPKVLKAPTCTEAGQQAGICEYCGKDTKQTIPAIGHNFPAPELVRQPTAEKPGLKQSKCSRCGEVKEEEIPCIPAETTQETTLPEATTEAETQPVVALPEETLPVSNVQEETLPISAIPEETLSDSNAPGELQPKEAVLKMVIILAGALLLGVLTLIVVLAVRSKKK